MKVPCDYCGWEGERGTEVAWRRRHMHFACVDTEACDKRAEPRELAVEAAQQEVLDSQRR